jgi:hypothetical protein
MIVAAPILAALIAAPASAQLTARAHIEIPIGRSAPGYDLRSHQLQIRDYDQDRYGDWQDYYDDWQPETVYLYDGFYYDYPVVEYAQPIIVYRYRNDFFFAPRQREFMTWRDHYRPGPVRGYAGRNYGTQFRSGRQYAAPRAGGNSGRQYIAPRASGNGGRQYSAPRAGGNGDRQSNAPRDVRPQQSPRGEVGGRPSGPSRGTQGGGRVQAPHSDQGGHQGQAPHSAGRSRGRP